MTDKTKRKIFSITLTCITGWVFAYVATNVLVGYALGFFIWLPAVMGTTSTMLYGKSFPGNKKEMRNISFISLGIFCAGLLTFAWEGLVCIAMAAPIGLFFNWVGHVVGYSFIKRKANATTIIILLLLSVPSLMAFEKSIKVNNELRSVTTSIEINASPETVWKGVVSFSQLKPPEEFIFKTGIAYPTNATIRGHGVGAVRHCNFSTGSFVEPITVWNESYLLKFNVAEQPEPLKEISFYNIHPNHLHGFWVSKQGQFKLTQLSNGHTLLEGTTWYVNKIKPGIYWTLWSDYIVHKIHQRVLEHIKIQAELSAGKQ
jgi:hypothetical protein